MRQRIAILMLLLVASLGLAQTPALGPLLGPRPHAIPTPANAPHTPSVTFDASQLGSPVHLDHGWRVGITARDEAALAGFDDSTWSQRDAGDSFPDVPDADHTDQPAAQKADHAGSPRNHQRPWVWFRIHLHLAPHHGPLALLVELPLEVGSSVGLSASQPGVDVYLDGHKLVPEGPHADQPDFYPSISRLFSLPIDDDTTDVTLALRTPFIPAGFDAYTHFFATRTLLLGNPQDLSARLELWSTHRLLERLPRLVNSILLALLGIFLLALYFTHKGHREYLWLALHELFQAPIGFIEHAGSSAQLVSLWYWSLSLQLVAISAYLYFEFLVAFLGLGRRRWYVRLLRWTAPILAGILPLMLLVGRGSTLMILLVAVMLLSALWMVAWLLFVFVRLTRATMASNYEAGLLLVPLVLTLVGWIEPLLTMTMTSITGHAYHSPLTIDAGQIPIHFASVADFAGLISIVLIIFVRFLRMQRDRERVANELAAARSVQELMLPKEKLDSPGFEVDAVYNPANEVGGDFYSVRPTPDGGLVVVVGDVAGKGLEAAMNVSMLIGALRHLHDEGEYRPDRILTALNSVLSNSRSMTTCQAALFTPDGLLQIASAGHPPPYLNSQEVQLAGALPLGLVPSVDYPLTQLYLHPGDRLLLVSDGVVEARRPTGELFGFERLHNLSNQSAFYIAEAAQSFGQQDDITVVTVARAASS